MIQKKILPVDRGRDLIRNRKIEKLNQDRDQDPIKDIIEIDIPDIEEV
jgi:hypothetical protein